MYSDYYGWADGYSFCSFGLEFDTGTVGTLPLWMDVDDGEITIGANTELDPADEQTMTINLVRGDTADAERILWGTLTVRLERPGELPAGAA